jgi:hypothetical protein
MFLQKVHVENFFRKKTKKKSTSVFPRFFLFYGIFSAMGVRFSAMKLQKGATKNVVQNTCVEKFLPKNPAFSFFFPILFITFFGEDQLLAYGVAARAG